MAGREYMAFGRLLIGSFCCIVAAAQAQVPFINQPIMPSVATPGSPAVSITITGAGFAPGVKASWNGQVLATQFATKEQIAATIPASDLLASGSARVWATNVNGPSSNIALFSVTVPTNATAFGALPGYVTGASPVGAVVADFNRDGHEDIAVANEDVNAGNTISIFLGNGNGTFTVAASLKVNTPIALAVGDFNNDGRIDLAVADVGDNVVDVFLGNGDGTFETPQTFATGQEPAALEIGDFNGDGALDLATTAVGDSAVSILIGNGDGTFEAYQNYAAISPSGPLALGDFNGDGFLDLAVLGGQDISVLLGRGDGTFGPPSAMLGEAFPNALISADMNGDGILDLVSAEQPTGTSSTLAVFLGRGDGTFQSPVEYTTSSSPLGLIAQDVNGDGKIDLINSSGGSGVVSVLLGNGDGTFEAHSDTTVSQFSLLAVAAGDFNEDGRIDLAVTTGSSTMLPVIQASVAVAPTALSFATQPFGTSSAPQTLTLSNLTVSPINLNSFTFTGADGTDFSQTNTCGAILSSNASCAINVIFTPTETNTRTALLNVAFEGPGSPLLVNLAGVGDGPGVSLSASAIVFPTQPVESVSPTQRVTLTNIGDLPLTIISVSVTGDFLLRNNCNGTLQPQVTCTFAVAFKPTAKGVRTGAVTIADNAPQSPQSISLTGTGTLVAFTPTSLEFGSVTVGTTSAPQVLTLTNKGTSDLTGVHVSFFGSSAGYFSQTNNCGNRVSGRGTCTISVTFSPKSTGVHTSNVAVYDSGGGSPQLTQIAGTGK